MKNVFCLAPIQPFMGRNCLFVCLFVFYPREIIRGNEEALSASKKHLKIMVESSQLEEVQAPCGKMPKISLQVPSSTGPPRSYELDVCEILSGLFLLKRE